MEDKKKVGLIVMLVSLFLCGCPGICLVVFGGMMAGGRSWGWEVTGNPEAFGIPAICLGALFIAITIGAAVYYFMQARKAKPAEVVEDIEVPPAI